MTTPSAREYSQRLGVLRPEQLQAALDRFGLGTLLAAEPAPGGLFGQNVFLTSTTGAYVLRGCPHWDWQFPKERFFARELHAKTRAPVPHFYQIEDSPAIFGWSFALMPRLPGTQYLTPEARRELSSEDRLAIAGALGETLAELHTARWPWAGEYCMETDGIKAFAQTHADRVSTEIRQRTENSRRLSAATTQADADWVEGLLRQAGDVLRDPGPPTYVHHDYREGNALVQRQDGHWKVSGVFDLSENYVGDGEEDLVRAVEGYGYESSELAAAFVAAYVRGRPLRPGWRARLGLYSLCDRLVIWEYGQSHGWFAAGVTLREWAEPLIHGVIEAAARSA